MNNAYHIGTIIKKLAGDVKIPFAFSKKLLYNILRTLRVPTAEENKNE
ncbi:MAG: hypothetical protein IJN56_05355 [Clostridia bacterium]|nr:hypothetical protein [Clostridia bacterium]